MQNVPTAALAALIEAHGHQPVTHEQWVFTDGGFPGISGTFYRDESWHASVRQVDFRVLLEGGTGLTESFAVVGSSDEELLAQAMQRLSSGLLHVILAAFAGNAEAAEHLEIEDWTSEDGSTWQVFMTGWQLTTYSGERMLPPDEYFDRLQALILRRLSQGVEPVHWCRVFHSTVGRNLVDEVLWDGDSWTEALDHAAEVRWPAGGEQSSRLFMLLKKAP